MNESIDKDAKALKRKWEATINRTAASVMLLKSGAIIMLIAALFIQIFFASKIREKKYYPYIVLVKADGSFEYAGIVENDNFDLKKNETSVKFFLMDFVSNLRTVSAVPQNIQINLLKNYSFIVPSVADKLSAEIKADNPLVLSQTIRRDIVFTKFLALDNNTYELEWTEDIRQQGNIVLQEVKKATFTVIKKVPDTMEIAKQNPLCLYIKDFYLSDIRGEKKK